MAFIGCTDLNGRCSPMRGIQVPASYLLCLCPKVCPWGLSIPTVDEYQWYVQASVQRLERGDPCNALHTAMRSSKSLVHPPKALRPQILTSYSSQTQGNFFFLTTYRLNLFDLYQKLLFLKKEVVNRFWTTYSNSLLRQKANNVPFCQRLQLCLSMTLMPFLKV